MVTGKGLTLENDLVSTVSIWPVKGTHEEMKIGSERLHDGNFRFPGADNGGHQAGSPCVDVEPCRKG